MSGQGKDQLIAILAVTFDIIADYQSLISAIYLYLLDFLTAIDLGLSPSTSRTIDFQDMLVTIMVGCLVAPV